MINLDKIDISNFLPHRAPFLMVDKLLTLDENHVSTSFKINEKCIFVKDNIFNEVGLIECAAQTCSSIVGKTYFKDDDLEGKGTKLIGFISAIKKITIFSCPLIGATIITKAQLISRYDSNQYSISTLQCNIYEGKKELLSCQLNLFIQEVEQ
ncbi:MAG: ABC transporter permease [Flavobacteriaceae bacterium]|nr:ABC transporter permease [Flavobacteriaceae bacterium]